MKEVFTQRNEYIVFVEQVEEIEDFFDLILDGVEGDLFEEISEDSILNNDFINNIPTKVFSLRLSSEQYLALEGSSWSQIVVTDTPTEIPIQLYTDIFFDNEVEQLYIEDIKPVRIENKKK